MNCEGLDRREAAADAAPAQVLLLRIAGSHCLDLGR